MNLPTHHRGGTPPLVVYEVDVLEERPVTWQVMARSEAEARDKALSGLGKDISGVDYVTGEVVDVRRV